MRKYFSILIVAWTITVVAALLFNLYILRKNSEALVQTKSEAFFKLLVTIRQWNANHGLVYVPITETVQPNPFLQHKYRDIVSNFGDSLTLVNPAFMTRQLAELAEKNKIASFHITSLNPIRPANAADEWETKALRTFNGENDRFFERIKTGDSIMFRYMAPLFVEQNCLACHASQGYKLKDVRGGISINTAYHRDYIVHAKASSKKMFIVYALIYFIGFFLLLYFRSSHKQYGRNIKAKNEELQYLGTSKNKFFSVIAHDLRTPAANIKSLSETLQMQFDELSDEERKNYIELLVESANIHHDLLNTLLDLSRLQLGSKQYMPERLDIHALVDEVLLQTKLQAQQKQITQINHVKECFARADRNMVITVIRNIVTNAIKFTHPHGQVAINTEKKNAEITVSITDTGIGIADSIRDRIFAIDCNKSTAGTANESGTGLGLILCKEYVEHNGGSIWFDSEQGKGTTFFFTLPAAENA